MLVATGAGIDRQQVATQLGTKGDVEVALVDVDGRQRQLLGTFTRQ